MGLVLTFRLILIHANFYDKLTLGRFVLEDVEVAASPSRSSYIRGKILMNINISILILIYQY